MMANKNYSFLNQLQLIEKTILTKDFTREDFPQLVKDTLKESKLHFSRSLFFKEFFALKNLPLQHYQPSHFGSFNATLIRNDKFTIQIYIMDGESTELHRHTFFGFYLYLEGESLELCLTKTNDRKVSTNVFESDYQIAPSSLYNVFQGRVINPSLIHQVHRISGKTTVLMFMHTSSIRRPVELFLPPYFIKNANLTDLDWRKIHLLLKTNDKKQTILCLNEFRTDKLIVIRGRVQNLRFFDQRAKLKTISAEIDRELTNRQIKIPTFKLWSKKLELLRKKIICFR